MLGIGEMTGLHEIVQVAKTAMRMCCAVKLDCLTKLLSKHNDGKYFGMIEG